MATHRRESVLNQSLPRCHGVKLGDQFGVGRWRSAAPERALRLRSASLISHSLKVNSLGDAAVHVLRSHLGVGCLGTTLGRSESLDDGGGRPQCVISLRRESRRLAHAVTSQLKLGSSDMRASLR